MKITVQSPAKLNLFLDITGKRSDGYHLIDTIMQSVSLYDDITVTIDKDGSGISLSCSREDIPCDSSNTAYKAAEQFFAHTGLPMGGVHIKIKKRIPSGAGMAGGSTDAAGVLYCLNELTGADLSKDELAEIGERIGADVPFCVYGGTMSAGGIGTILSPLPDMPDAEIVIVMPSFRISTKEAYAKSDTLGYDEPKSMDAAASAVCSGHIGAIAGNLYNRFEEVADIAEIASIQSLMKDCGALGALMTGSGSAVYGLFDSKDRAEDCESKLREQNYHDIYIVHPVACGPVPMVHGGIIGSLLG